MNFKSWFYSLPIWQESDNYIYFLMAILFVIFMDLDTEILKALSVAIVTALVVKGKGNNDKS